MNQNLLSAYKDVESSRGFTYHCLFSPAVGNKPTLLFVHGFPGISYDWYHQANYFSERGFGVVVPDMLGYGGSSKPTDTSFFKHSEIAQDLVDVLDVEKVERVIAVGHDWGSAVVSCLSINHSDRFLGFAWLALAYDVLSPFTPLDETFEMHINMFGRPLLGYWKFFEQESAAATIEKNLESFLCVLYPDDADSWLTLMNIPGEIQSFVENGKTTKRASYLTEEHYSRLVESLSKGGLKSSLNWYLTVITGINKGCVAPMASFLDAPRPGEITDESLLIKKPAFFGAAKKDHVCLYEPAVPHMEKHAVGGLKIVEFDTGHRLQLEQPENVNRELEVWIRDTFKL